MDKLLHFIVSSTLFTFINIKTKDLKKSVLWVISIGLLKEIYDYFDYGLFSIGDILFDSLGIIYCIVLFYLIKI